MCGRYTLTASLEDLEELLPGWTLPGEVAPRYNVAPTQDVLVALNDGTRAVSSARWGLVPWWADDPRVGSRMINARSEDAATRPAFRDALRARRCLVLADGFYEWRPAREPGGRRRPVLVRRPDGRPFAFAGLWDEWRPQGMLPGFGPAEPLRSCTILTREPTAEVAAVHDRMPVVLEPAAFDAWLDPSPKRPEELAPLLAPRAERFELRDVSPVVNDPRHDAPDCVAPLAEE